MLQPFTYVHSHLLTISMAQRKSEKATSRAGLAWLLILVQFAVFLTFFSFIRIQLSAINVQCGAPSQQREVVVIGLMVTQHVPDEVIDAHHYSVQDFNAAQQQFKLKLFFFVGKEGHPMLHQQLAMREGQEVLNRWGQNANLPQFVQGQFDENMNAGKTLAWFQYASRAYPHSSWIVKMDTDVAVDWMSVQQWWMQSADSFKYMGFVATHQGCGAFDYCPPLGCHNMSGSCWVYMAGGFYGVTTPLAMVLSQCSYYSSNAVGHEDLTFGRAVKRCAGHRTVEIVADDNSSIPWCHSKAVNRTHIRNGWKPNNVRCS
jgi:hypothetical protein